MSILCIVRRKIRKEEMFICLVFLRLGFENPDLSNRKRDKRFSLNFPPLHDFEMLKTRKKNLGFSVNGRRFKSESLLLWRHIPITAKK